MNVSEIKLIEDFFGVPESRDERDAHEDPVLRRWQIIKRITLIALLAGAFLFYYLLDKLQQGFSAV